MLMQEKTVILIQVDCNQLIALLNFCREHNLACISSVYSIDFSYESDANGARSTIDNFAIWDLIASINILVLLMSIICLIILRRCMYINLPIDILYMFTIYSKTKMDDGMLLDYKYTLHYIARMHCFVGGHTIMRKCALY